MGQPGAYRALFDVDGDGVEELPTITASFAEIDSWRRRSQGLTGTKLGIETWRQPAFKAAASSSISRPFCTRTALVGYDDLLRIIAADDVAIEPATCSAFTPGCAAPARDESSSPIPQG